MSNAVFKASLNNDETKLIKTFTHRREAMEYVFNAVHKGKKTTIEDGAWVRSGRDLHLYQECGVTLGQVWRKRILEIEAE